MRAAVLMITLFVSATAAACTSQDPAPTPDPSAAGMGAPSPESAKKKGAKNACASCHTREFEEVTHPVHVGKKPTRCEVCHLQTGWHPTELQHPAWELSGKHATADCFYCHEGTPPKYGGTTKACFGCHAKDFEKPKFPEHATYAKTCDDCHTTDGWKPVKEGRGKAPAPGGTHDDPAPAPSGSASAHRVQPEPQEPAPSTHHGTTPKPKPTANPTSSPTSKPTEAPTPTKPTAPPDTNSGASKSWR